MVSKENFGLAKKSIVYKIVRYKKSLQFSISYLFDRDFFCKVHKFQPFFFLTQGFRQNIWSRLETASRVTVSRLVTCRLDLVSSRDFRLVIGSKFFPPFVGFHTDGVGKLRKAKACSKAPALVIKDADETEASAHTHKCEGFVSCCCCLHSFALLLRDRLFGKSKKHHSWE